MNESAQYRSFFEFYPCYLSEHRNRTSRLLHFAGTSIAVVLLVCAFVYQAWWLILVAVVVSFGMGFSVRRSVMCGRSARRRG